MLIAVLIALNILLITAEQFAEQEFCNIKDQSCATENNFIEEKLLFYDVNPPEGFNLRRDVYMRFAIMLAEAQKGGKKLDWSLVLPPWYQMYHWRNQVSNSKPIPWSAFFDIDSLRSYSPVLELHEVFDKYRSVFTKTLEIDTLYVLQNYADPFEGGTFKDKWEQSEHDCEYKGQYWGYNNITAKETICIKFQGKVSMLWEVILLHPSSSKIMFAHGEIPLHDNYGTKSYWDCRKSMKFSSKLIKAATTFIKNNFGCDTEKCNSYLSVHWRRQDFSRSRTKDVPTLDGTAKQIHKTIKKTLPNINKVFVSTDAPKNERDALKSLLIKYNYETFFFITNTTELNVYKDGGIAIIDQIIASRAAYFIGTHESTFSFRIQEEREILGFNSSTTFNRLCPDKGKCEKVSKWTVVH